MNRYWEFPHGLSIETSSIYCSMKTMNEVREQLIQDYSFPSFDIEEVRFGLKLTFGEDYPSTKKEWVLDVYDYHKSLGVMITHD